MTNQIIINTDQSSKRLIILVSILTSLSVTLAFNLLSYGLPARAVNPVPTVALVPTITSISPTNVVAGSVASNTFPVTIIGTNFNSSSKVFVISKSSYGEVGPYEMGQHPGAPAISISATSITTTIWGGIPGTSTIVLSTPGVLEIYVRNYNSSGNFSQSGPAYFYIKPNANSPSISYISPTQAPCQGPAGTTFTPVTVNVYGAGFMQYMAGPGGTIQGSEGSLVDIRPYGAGAATNTVATMYINANNVRFSLPAEFYIFGCTTITSGYKTTMVTVKNVFDTTSVLFSNQVPFYVTTPTIVTPFTSP